MKLSTLIAKLEELKATEGDKEICFATDEGGIITDKDIVIYLEKTPTLLTVLNFYL